MSLNKAGNRRSRFGNDFEQQCSSTVSLAAGLPDEVTREFRLKFFKGWPLRELRG
jgi:hypothetical protein